ncbi:MAG: Asp-tRNA(Asn)/Glu-tRNA(Gln) amidotransferase subunit GatB [Pseudomonadota bacterium]
MTSVKKYEVVIGLEIHAQLSTKSKMFCSCPVLFGQAPNSNICPVCSGHPGTLPSLNSAAVMLAVKTALALNCKINKNSIFARKNYFYPDLPKGYQISQYDQPLAQNGWVEIVLKDGTKKKIGITRVHMEEDAGKNIHAGRESTVDLNRAGVPLVEIVSEPDIRSAEEANAYFKKLRSILGYIEVSDCNMEEGNLRCDANISLRPVGEKKLGVKTEIKNLNSFRFVEKALGYEAERQEELLSGGGKVIQETMLFDTTSGVTKAMRQKEGADDYRYFPEPDLNPLILQDAFINKIKSEMIELPDAKHERFISSYGLSFSDADVITSDKDVAAYYEELCKLTAEPKLCSNWLQTEVLRTLNENKIEIKDLPITPKGMAELLTMLKSGAVNHNTAKDIFNEMVRTRESAKAIVDKKGLSQIQDESLIEKLVDETLAELSSQVQQYKEGKTGVMGFIVGHVMKKSKGRANPAVVNSILKKKIG